MKDEDVIKEARERWKDCEEHDREARELRTDDLRFSNPAEPEQWPEELKQMRQNAVGGARPCLTFDQTNPFLNQVINAARESKPSITVRPVDSGSDVKVAETLSCLIRHIEDHSRADIAYDTAIDYAARCGLGYFRVVTEVTNYAQNEQEILIQRIADPDSVRLDPDWQEPDGSDIAFGFVESQMTKRAFTRKYPKAKAVDFDTDKDGWFTEKMVRIVEYFNVREEKENILVIVDENNEEAEYCEKDYWDLVQETGMRPDVVRTYEAKTRKVDWYKLTGAEVLEKTEFPASYVPIIPVIGSEVWIEGKRHLSGLIRPMKDPQRAYNYDRNNYIEHVSLQNKIPYLIAAEAVEGREGEWGSANTSNAAYLTYNYTDSDGKTLPTPQRQMPPAASSAYAQGSQMALADIQAGIGMFQANLGQRSNETSGVAIDSRKAQGETASFHYIDNRNRSIRHCGRILLEMIPRVYDTKRQLRILGESGEPTNVTLDPDLQQSHEMKGNTLAAFNPSIGNYDVSVQAGPAYGTRRQEALQALKEVINGNPQALALLGDQLISLTDMPNAEKFAKRMKFMLPPEVKAAEDAENQGQESPEVMQVKQQAQQAIDELSSHMKEAMAQIQQMQAALDDKDKENQMRMETEIIKSKTQVEVERIKAMAMTDAAEINAASQSAMPKEEHAEPMQPQQPVNVINNSGMENEKAVELVATIQQLAESVTEQNRHLFLAVSAIADELSAPKEPELKTINGRMVRAMDGSYTFEAIKN